jgi:DNA topoisomerase VI subunit A
MPRRTYVNQEYLPVNAERLPKRRVIGVLICDIATRDMKEKQDLKIQSDYNEWNQMLLTRPSFTRGVYRSAICRTVKVEVEPQLCATVQLMYIYGSFETLT